MHGSSRCRSLRLIAPRGFTMIELMVTIAIMVILMTLAAPSFTQLLASNRLTSQANDLVGDIAYARNESVTRGVRVTICMSTDGATCGGANWASGRIVFVDTNNDGVRQAGETLLKASSALSGDTTLVAAGFPNAGYIKFRPYGGLDPATPGSFKVCSVSTATGRQVAVATFGTPTATRVACP